MEKNVDVIEFMRLSKPQDVWEWNAAREKAKKIYSDEEISKLDASGLIVELLNHNKIEQNGE